MTILEKLFEQYADNGREARAMLSHLHTNGSTSFANSRDEFEMEHGREPGGYEFFDRTHKTKDGVYPENTNTQELIDMAKSKIDASVASSSSSKPRIEVEDEVFNELMYDKDNSNQKPVGYGFGVKFARHKKETANLIMRLSSSVSDLLTAVQSGRVSPETLAATNSALRTITAQ
ncbi:Exodeoxyribonuclease 7 large subunit, partial [Bienertia sinuspersici]